MSPLAEAIYATQPFSTLARFGRYLVVQVFDRPTIQKLITTNWLRTAAWTTRAALITYWTLKLTNH